MSELHEISEIEEERSREAEREAIIEEETKKRDLLRRETFEERSRAKMLWEDLTADEIESSLHAVKSESKGRMIFTVKVNGGDGETVMNRAEARGFRGVISAFGFELHPIAVERHEIEED